MENNILATLNSYNLLRDVIYSADDLSDYEGEHFYEAIKRGDYFVLPYIYDAYIINTGEEKILPKAYEALHNGVFYLSVYEGNLTMMDFIYNIYGITNKSPYLRDDILDDFVIQIDNGDIELDTIRWVYDKDLFDKSFLEENKYDLIQLAIEQDREDFLVWLENMIGAYHTSK